MIERFRVVPAAYIVFRRGSEVLLQLRQNTGYRDGHWACAAAGHVEEGESVTDAACREAEEELGTTVYAAHLVPLTAMHRTQGDHRPINERVDFFFECRHWRGTPRLAEPEKAADLAWFDLAALPTPVVPHELAVFQALQVGVPSPIMTFGFV